MEITHEVTIDLLRQSKKIIKVVQEDSTRRLLLTTMLDGVLHDVTSDLESGEEMIGLVEYRRADGTSGIYDTTSDGRTAVEASGVGKWLVNLDGACFTVPGWAQINVRFMTEGGKVLHTFAISVRVQDTACPDESGGDPTQIESIADMKAAITTLFTETMSGEAKAALLYLLDHVAYTDEHGQDYYDDLETELFRTADVVSISAVFEQGSATIYDTDSLDSLRQYLTVTATYEDLTTGTVSAYTLSGTLAAGTSTITVSYGGKTDTFTVTVSTHLLYSIEDTSFNNEKIVVEQTPFATDSSMTIALDITVTSKPSSGNGSQPRLINVYRSSPSGFCVAATIGSSGNLTVNYMDEGVDTPIASSVSTGRIRLVFTHAASGATGSFYVRIDNGSKLTKIITATFTASSYRLAFGYGSTSNILPVGVINKAALYDTVMSSDWVDSFLGL